MLRCRMRYLLLSSLLFLLVACAKPIYSHLQVVSTASSACLKKFQPDITSIVYKTNVDVVGKHLSGLLLFKRMPDSTLRAVFSSQMGLTFFDFVYTTKGFKVNYCIKQLNRKAVIRELQKIIALLLLHDRDPDKAEVLTDGANLYYTFRHKKDIDYYLLDKNCEKLFKIENANTSQKKLIMDLTERKNGMPDSVYVAHQKFDFTISLKQLSK